MSAEKRMDETASAGQDNRADLLRFVRRLIVAERAITATNVPTGAADLRRWLFRIASNLAIDQLRREGVWSRATAEVAAIAHQHLAFCFSCTLRSLPAQRAAALLLATVYGFTVKETAGILGASTAQAKKWIQEARAALDARYADT